MNELRKLAQEILEKDKVNPKRRKRRERGGERGRERGEWGEGGERGEEKRGDSK